MMAKGGEAEDTRAGFGSAIMSPVDTYQGMRAIEDFAVEATERYRQAKGTKAFAVDNILDAFRHFTGSMLLYRDYSDSLAGTALTVNEMLGAPGDYIAGAIDPNAASGSASREMDYHNNEVAKLHASKIPTAKFAQMSNRAVEEYARRYFDEIEEMYADGSIDSVDPRLVPMFSPAGNEGYEPMTPEVDTKSLYIKGPDNNWMDNPNHPDVVARQRKALGGQARMPSAEEQANYTTQYIDPSDRVIDESAISRVPVDELPTMKQVPYGDKPIEQDPFDELMDAAEGKESNVDQYPEVMDAQTYFNFTRALLPKVNREITTDEAITTLRVARDMISDREHAKYLEMLEKSKTPGDKVLGRPYAPDYDYSDKGYFYYDEEDDKRLLSENKPPRVT